MASWCSCKILVLVSQRPVLVSQVEDQGIGARIVVEGNVGIYWYISIHPCRCSLWWWLSCRVARLVSKVRDSGRLPSPPLPASICHPLFAPPTHLLHQGEYMTKFI